MNIPFPINRLLTWLHFKTIRPHYNGHGIHSPFLFRFLNEVVYANDIYVQLQTGSLTTVCGLGLTKQIIHFIKKKLFPSYRKQCFLFRILKQSSNFNILYQKSSLQRINFNTIPESSYDKTLIIIDSIRKSRTDYDAWLEICEHHEVRQSVDFFNLGIVFLNRKLQKEHFKIYY